MIAVNDTVQFNAAVVRRTQHDARVAAMRGTVLAIKGNVAEVDTGGTYNSEDGRAVRFIPVANLARIN